MSGSFEDLVAYKRAAALADQLHDAVPRWSPLYQRSIGVQLLGAADSVGANIAEAFGRWHRTDQRRFLYFARGSAPLRNQHWIARAETQRLLPAGTRHKAEEVGRILNGLISAHAKRKN